MFNRMVVKALTADNSADSLVAVRSSLISLLKNLVALVTKTLLLHKYQTVVALIITLVHSRDIVADLIEGRVHHPDDFAWTRFVFHFCFEEI